MLNRVRDRGIDNERRRVAEVSEPLWCTLDRRGRGKEEEGEAAVRCQRVLVVADSLSVIHLS